MRALLLAFLGVWTLASPAFPRGQEAASGEKKESKKIEIDFSAGYDTLSEDLEKSLRWRNLFKIFGVSEVHVFPSRESGPYPGPPLRIWGNGWGTSLWRDPVTGWPLQ